MYFFSKLDTKKRIPKWTDFNKNSLILLISHFVMVPALVTNSRVEYITLYRIRTRLSLVAPPWLVLFSRIICSSAKSTFPFLYLIPMKSIYQTKAFHSALFNLRLSVYSHSSSDYIFKICLLLFIFIFKFYLYLNTSYFEPEYF